MSLSPIAIICHAGCEPPGYLCSYFDRRDVPYIKVNILENMLSGDDLKTLSGIILMGGPYSVYDNHAWINDEKQLILKAINQKIPMMGVCFGAQLISKVLGAKVTPAEIMEAGWHTIKADTSLLKHRHPLKLKNSFEVFEWHEDTFTIPHGAIPIFKGKGTKNQGYVFDNILAMQFHLEMTQHMVSKWIERYKECLPKRLGSIYSYQEISDQLDERIDKLHAIADKIYDWWLEPILNKHNKLKIDE